MSKIFISYRRQDSRPVATLIYDPLAKHFEAKFGAGAVFMDVHGIPLGVNFRSYLNEQVANAELLLALIADRWLTSVDEHGARRIDSPNDFVRIEIEAALKRGVPVVPVYVDDAKFLREADLPEGLKELAWYNGYNLSTSGDKFAASIASLIAKLEPHLAGAIRPAQPEPLPVKPVAPPTIIRAAPVAPMPVSDDKARAKKHFENGEEHYNKGDYDHAIADFDQAIRLDPKNALAYYNRGRAYNSRGDYDRAIADLDQAIRLDPRGATAYNNRGVAYERKGAYGRAIADFDHALAIDPNYQLAAENRRIAEEKQKRAKQKKKKGWLG